jgi:tetratricopeptide (TPR) repeat protein
MPSDGKQSEIRKGSWVYFFIAVVLAVILFVFLWFFASKISFPSGNTQAIISPEQPPPPVQTDKLLKFLKHRQDKEALAECKHILLTDQKNITARWAEAEILRRSYRYKESEELLLALLHDSPEHIPSLISLANIKYHANDLQEATKILSRLLSRSDLDNGQRALVYVVLGSVAAQKAAQGGLLLKISQGPRIKGYFLKAKALSADLPEVYLGLGSFYLLAPSLIGGDVDKAIKELETAFYLSPQFATVNARLAQAYLSKGDMVKYEFYFNRVKALEPDNAVLKEIESEQ